MFTTLKSFFTADCATSERDRANYRRLNMWLFAWLGTWLAIGAAVKYEIVAVGVLPNLLALIPLGLGIAAVHAYRHFLTEADELRRKIELDALAVAFGVGVVGGLSYWLFGQTGLFSEIDLLWTIVAMIVTYSITVQIGLAKYS